MSFSEFIVYADESGDHGLDSINPQNPVFVLAFCIFLKQDYISRVVPVIQEVKFDYWGHDAIILRSYDIRRQRGEFSIFTNKDLRNEFLERLNRTIAAMPFTLIASVIDKNKHRKQYAHPIDPYSISLAFCMERLQMFLGERNQTHRTTHILVECRGDNEDKKLKQAFNRVRAGRNYVGEMPNLSIRFMDKKHNSTGLQIADLVAYPLGRHVINPSQRNRAYEVIEGKLRRSPAGKIAGYGLKVFP